MQQQIEKSHNLCDELENTYAIGNGLYYVFFQLLFWFFYLRYATPQYKIKTTLLIKQDDNTMSNELAAFQDFGMFGDGNSNIEKRNPTTQIKNPNEECGKRFDFNNQLFQARKTQRV
jgi:hypothetical protein